MPFQVGLDQAFADLKNMPFSVVCDSALSGIRTNSSQIRDQGLRILQPGNATLATRNGDEFRVCHQENSDSVKMVVTTCVEYEYALKEASLSISKGATPDTLAKHNFFPKKLLNLFTTALFA